MNQTFFFFLRATAALGLLIGLQAQAATFDADELNHNASLQDMAVYLKSQFKTDEDHRQIDADVDQLNKSVGKWSWRFEPAPKDPGQLQFRVNGRVQWNLQKADSGLPGEYSLNGQSFKMAPGKGYRATLDQAVKILKSSNQQASRFSLIPEAHALFPLAAPIWAALGFAVTAGAAHAESRAMGAGRTFNCPIVAPQSPSAGDFRNYVGGRMCDGFQKRGYRTNANTRIRAVRDNFCNPVLDRRGPHSCNRDYNGTMSSRNEFAVDCPVRYASVYGPEGAIAMCKCIRRKTNSCTRGGWNMTEPLAVVTCQAAYDSAYCRGVPPPTYGPAPGYGPNPGYLGPQTPGVRPKTGGYVPPAQPAPYTPPAQPYEPAQPPPSARD